MRQAISAIVLCSSVTMSFAGDAASPSIERLAQNQACAARCTVYFSQCLQLCGQNCTTAGISAAITAAATSNAANPNPTATTTARAPTIFRNCDSEQTLCLINCQSSPNG